MDDLISLRHVSKTFWSEKGQSLLAVDDVSLKVGANEFVCLLGPSGSGKSTLLRILAGLTPASAGDVRVLGREIRKPIPEASMVLQDYSLLPWRTVLENVAFGLELRKRSRPERLEIARAALQSVGLGSFCEAYPYELSGGMQQRAAIARSLAIAPQVLYMDEPFGALDAFTRKQMQEQLLRLWLRDKKTVVFVTHSVEEAVFLGTRVVVMSARPGRIVADLPIDLPHPRRSADPEFGSLVDHLMSMLMGLADEPTA